VNCYTPFTFTVKELLQLTDTNYTGFTDHVSEEGNKIARPLFMFLNQLTSDLDFCICMGHDHSSPGLKSKDE